MYALKSTEGQFSGGTRIEIPMESTKGDYIQIKAEGKDLVRVRTAANVQRVRTHSRWNEDHNRQTHTKELVGRPAKVDFVTTVDNIVKLRERTK